MAQYHLGLSTYNDAWNILNMLKDHKYLKGSNYSRQLGLGNGFYINQEGIHFITREMNIPEYQVIENKPVQKFDPLKVISTRNIGHEKSRIEWYYKLVKIYGKDGFTWYLKNYTSLISTISESKIEVDSIIRINNREYFLEVDLGSENNNDILTKFNNYGKLYKENYERFSMPPLIFTVNCTYNNATVMESLSNISKDKNLTRLKEELLQLQKDMRKHNKEVRAFKNKTQNQLIEELHELKSALTILEGQKNKPATREVTKQINKLEEYIENSSLVTNDEEFEAIFQRVRVIKKQINEYKAVITEDTIVDKERKRVEVIRTNLLKDSDGNNVEFLKYAMSDGLDVHIMKNSETYSYFEELNSRTVSCSSIVKQYFSNHLWEKHMRNADYNVTAEDEGLSEIFGNMLYFKSSVRVTHEGRLSTLFCIDDLSFGNIGGYYRVERASGIMSGMDDVEIYYILVIDSYEEAEQVISLPHGNVNFGFILRQYLSDKNIEETINSMPAWLCKVNQSGQRFSLTY